MDQAVRLVPLVCLKCSTPIPAATDEVAWVCTQCGQGQFLDEAARIFPLEFFYSSSLEQNATGKPYWVANGTVQMDRQTYGKSKKDAGAAQHFWSQPHRFLLPAFSAPLDTLLSLGVQYLVKPPDLTPGAPARFEPVVLAYEDITPAAEFLVVAIEAARKDDVKQIDFHLELDKPALWILP